MVKGFTPPSISLFAASRRHVLISALSCFNPQAIFDGSVFGGVASLVCATATPITEQSQPFGCSGAFWGVHIEII